MIKSSQAKTEFKQVVKGENFMTPTILGYYFSGDYAVELSRGYGITGGNIWGVTVVDPEAQKANHELSECFNTKKEAMQHIERIGK